jgi:hypothetical protein
MRRAQLKFRDHWVAEEVADLREDWMDCADRILDDDAIVTAVYEALGKRHPKSRSRGRRGAPAEMVLRLLVLKHVRNWSYDVLEREVRANLVYRDFARVGGGKMPDAKTMGRWGLAVGPEGDQAGPRADDDDRAGSRSCARPADARGYHGGGDQCSLSDRLEPFGRRRARAHPHHEEDH